MSYKKNKKNFSVGSDAELICVRGNTVIESGDTTDEYEEFGADGSGINFEVRPSPSVNPLQGVANIRGIFMQQIAKNPEFAKYKWIAGSNYRNYPLGGHIHFGIKQNLIGPVKACEILTQYVGCISLLVEDKSQSRRRRCEGYGTANDYREQDHGFEWRTPSSWLVSPYIAAAFLCLSKAVMYEVLNNPKFSPTQYVDSGVFNDIAKNYEDDSLIREKFPKIWAEITKMKLYQSYKPYIDILHYLVTKKLTWFPKGGLKETWGLMDVNARNKNVSLDVIWSRYNQSIVGV